eukprot:CAMPEP_0172758966 /NCGR_PEP_ID=MMETSP1074-20121228/166776_1 /TAXON_ID=2916 /ORGANISM="Ceratium fusus, Strain PA161109" /LENGTH=344 /DNA_ID=CAMNT_0013592653 /DNA_START=14 /DNA_END=1045 /DNA_ORIENTATION=+
MYPKRHEAALTPVLFASLWLLSLIGGLFVLPQRGSMRGQMSTQTPLARYKRCRPLTSAALPVGASVEPLVGETTSFKNGALQRNKELQHALAELHVNFELLDKPPQCALLRPALRAYKKFVLPRSQRALDLVSCPGRANVVAKTIKHMIDEALSADAAWKMQYSNVQVSDEFNNTPRYPLTLILDGLRSAQNVGSLLLTCEHVRLEKVVFCNITPRPPDPAVMRVAQSAATRVPQEYASNAAEVVHRLRKEGCTVWALETTSQALDFSDVVPPQPLALVLGHEGHGVSLDVLDACDEHVRIRMRGVKNSLNVAVAGSIAAFDVVRQWRGATSNVGGGSQASLDR